MRDSSHDRLFDVVFTNRLIINISKPNEQKKLIEQLWKLVKPGGKMILCESFCDGLKNINKFRFELGLTEIEPPWHNCYLKLNDIKALRLGGNYPDIIEFSGGYYYISRVLNAYLANKRGEKPCYDSDINKIALKLSNYGDCGQVKGVIFNKDSLK